MKRLLVVVLLLIGPAGCASTEPAAPPVCASWASVQNTVDHIRNVNVSANGLSALQPHLTQLREELEVLYADARAQFGTQADALRASVEQLGAALRVAKDDPNRTNLATVRTSVGEVRADASTLRTALASTC